MSWTCALHPSDLYVAVISGLCVGLCVGIVGTRYWMAHVEWTILNRHSQGGSDGQTF